MSVKKTYFAIQIILLGLVLTSLCNQTSFNSLKKLSTGLDSLAHKSDITPIKPKVQTKSYRADFFKNMMGFGENSEFIQPYKDKNQKYNEIFLSKNLIVEKQIDGKMQFIIRSFNGQEYQAGFFTDPTIITLQEQAAKLPKIGGGRFNLIIGTETNLLSPYRNSVDIGALQADPKNVDAVFQVASNFSALEPIGIDHNPERGITGYINDYTQGPFASISAAPGLFYRMYGIFFDSAKEPREWRQTADHQIELLGGGAHYPWLKKIFPITNGYINYADNPDSLNLPFTQKDKDEIRIGYHRDMQVLYGFTENDTQHDITDKNQIINQVFTAAVDFGYLNAGYKKNPVVVQRAKALIDAAYKGTLLAAITNKKKKVFLTLIGGGVFQNNISWIAESIAKNENLIKQHGLEVTLIVYSYKDLSKYGQNTQKDLDTFKNLMSKLVTSSNGSVIIDGNQKTIDGLKSF